LRVKDILSKSISEKVIWFSLRLTYPWADLCHARGIAFGQNQEEVYYGTQSRSHKSLWQG
jgi:hypothetical protein